MVQERQSTNAEDAANNKNNKRRANDRTSLHMCQGSVKEVWRSVLGLQNQNIGKKFYLSVFCEIIVPCIIKECKNGEDVITATKDRTVYVAHKFKKDKI